MFVYNSVLLCVISTLDTHTVCSKVYTTIYIYISILGLFQSKLCVLTGCDALDPYLVYNLTIIYTYCSSIMTASRK